jgi:hypothetical protein
MKSKITLKMKVYSSEDKVQASVSGLSTGKKNSAGKIRRLINLHADSVFLKGGMLVF